MPRITITKTDSSGKTERRGILTPGLFSSTAAVVSGYYAYTGIAAQTLDASDKALLAAVVAGGTFIFCRLGTTAGGLLGGWLGFLGGALLGGSAGAALGGAAGQKGQKAETAATGGAAGGVAGGVLGGMTLATVGALAGFWYGAVLGHDVSRDAAMKYIFDKPQVGQSQKLTHETAPRPTFLP